MLRILTLIQELKAWVKTCVWNLGYSIHQYKVDVWLAQDSDFITVIPTATYLHTFKFLFIVWNQDKVIQDLIFGSSWAVISPRDIQRLHSNLPLALAWHCHVLSRCVRKQSLVLSCFIPSPPPPPFVLVVLPDNIWTMTRILFNYTVMPIYIVEKWLPGFNYDSCACKCCHVQIKGLLPG